MADIVEKAKPWHSKLTRLPLLEKTDVAILKAKHIIPTLGAVKLANGKITFGLSEMKALPNIETKELKSIDKYYQVIAVLYRASSGLDDAVLEMPVAYSLVSSTGQLIVVSTFEIAAYTAKIANIDQSCPDIKLGLGLGTIKPPELKISTASGLNKIYITLPDVSDIDTYAGYHNADGSVRILPPSMLTTAYLQSLSNEDLLAITMSLYTKYFKKHNRILNITSVKWGASPTIKTTISLTSNNNADANTALQDYSISSADIILPRERCLAHPETLYSLLLHELIHTLGSGNAHGMLFRSWVEGFAVFRNLNIYIWNGETDEESTKILKEHNLYDFYIDKMYSLRHTIFYECPRCGNEITDIGSSTLKCGCGELISFK